MSIVQIPLEFFFVMPTDKNTNQACLKNKLNPLSLISFKVKYFWKIIYCGRLVLEIRFDILYLTFKVQICLDYDLRA